MEKLRFFPLAVARGEGCWLIEPGGRRLLDLSASWGAGALGHGHPAIGEVLSRVAAAPPGASALSAILPEMVALAEELLALVPGSGARRVYLGHPVATPATWRRAAGMAERWRLSMPN